MLTHRSNVMLSEVEASKAVLIRSLTFVQDDKFAKKKSCGQLLYYYSYYYTRTYTAILLFSYIFS